MPSLAAAACTHDAPIARRPTAGNIEEGVVFSTRFSYFTLVNEKTIYLEAVIGETDFE